MKAFILVCQEEEQRKKKRGKYFVEGKCYNVLETNTQRKEKEENNLENENVTTCDRQTYRQNCEDRARILDSEFAIFSSSVRRSVESSNPQIIQERYPPNRSLPSLQLSPQLLN